jgi:hypothetical protein
MLASRRSIAYTPAASRYKAVARTPFRRTGCTAEEVSAAGLQGQTLDQFLPDGSDDLDGSPVGCDAHEQNSTCSCERHANARVWGGLHYRTTMDISAHWIEAESGADPFNRGLDLGLFVHRQVVEHDNVAGLQRRHGHLLEIRGKGLIADQAVVRDPHRAALSCLRNLSPEAL